MMGNGNADSRSGARGRRTRTGLHAVLLACVAGLGMPRRWGGPIAYRELTTSAETVPQSPCNGGAARTNGGLPAGFADLVAKVRPSVISYGLRSRTRPCKAVTSGR
jgi:hypothetical protein